MGSDILGTFCQKCMTWNPGERESCLKCGTRLLIVTGDTTWTDAEEERIEDDEDLDEHLLERITNLEDSLHRVETYLDSVSDILGKLERSEVMLRNGLMSLVQEMEKNRQLDAQAFSERWQELVDENLQLLGARELFTRYRPRILPIAKPKSMSQLRRALLETAALLDASKLPEAADRLAQALPLDPKNYELIYTIASLKNIAQMPEEAEQLVKRVLQLSPRHYEAWMLLARLLFDLPERADEAVEALRRAAELRSDEAEPRIQLAELLLDEEDFQSALDAALEAVALQRDGETLRVLGEIHLARGEAAKAIASFKEASGHLPGDPDIRERLAEAYLLQGERPKAFAILSELLGQHPGDPDLLLLMDAEDSTQLRSARGGKAEARRLLDEAESWLQEGLLAEAETWIRRARRKDKSQRLEWIELQLAWKKSPEKALAPALAFSASRRHPRLCFMALRMALDYLMNQEGRAEEVRAALSAFLAAHPKSTGAWEAAIIRQAYRLLSGKLTEADLEEVRRLAANPLPGQAPRARALLGQYLLEMHRPQDVVELLDPVLEKEPTTIVYFQLGTALAALGERAEAVALLKEGLEAAPGDLDANQLQLIQQKMQALLDDLQRAPVSRS